MATRLFPERLASSIEVAVQGMTESIVEGFAAMAEMAGDAVWSSQLQKRVAAILADKRVDQEALLSRAYLEAEADLLRRSGGKLREEDVRKTLSGIFSKTADRYPAFNLLFLSKERQFLSLSNALLKAYLDGWRVLLGRREIARAVGSAFDGTPWSNLKVDSETGFEFNPLRMRSLQESVELTAAFYENLFRGGRAVMGDELNRRVFEKAFRRQGESRGFLPTFKNLLGATPQKALGAEKAKRLHELETETTAQARDIRAADEDLRRQAERLQQTVGELEETKKKLEIVGQARSEFIDVVSHQFRTPLSSIRWNAELLTDALAEEKIDAQYREAIESTRSRSVYLIETLDRVFATLDIETGKMVLDAKPGFLWEAVQDVYNQYEKDIKRKNLKWKFHRTKDQLVEIVFDKNKIMSALKIIIGNAIVYNNDGGTISVDLTAKKINGLDYLACSVTDEGIGIPKEDLARVMDKFYRSKTSILKAPDGTGLGMYIVKNIIEAHRGQVRIESEVGKGTTVSFALPAA